MEQKSKTEKAKNQSNSNKNDEEKIQTLKKCLELREAQFKELKIKYEASIEREKELTNAFNKVQSIMEQLGLKKETNNASEAAPEKVTQKKTQNSKKKPKNKSNLQCEVCQKPDHELKDCFYVKEANKSRNNTKNEKKSNDPASDKNGASNAVKKVEESDSSEKKEMKGVTKSDDEYIKQHKDLKTVTGYLPMFPLGTTVEAKIGSKTCPTVLLASGSQISSIGMAEAKRLGLLLIPNPEPVKIEFWNNTFTISTHVVSFAPEVQGRQMKPYPIYVVQKQTVPIICGYDWMSHSNIVISFRK